MAGKVGQSSRSRGGRAGGPGIQIGQLLVEQGVLTPQQVRHVLQVQKLSHRPFGDLAERLFGIDPRAVEDAWVEQYLRVAGTVDLSDVEVDTECLRLLNRRQAWQFHLLPLGRDHDAVQMATSAEDLVRSVNFASRKFYYFAWSLERVAVAYNVEKIGKTEWYPWAAEILLVVAPGVADSERRAGPVLRAAPHASRRAARVGHQGRGARHDVARSPHTAHDHQSDGA